MSVSRIFFFVALAVALCMALGGAIVDAIIIKDGCSIPPEAKNIGNWLELMLPIVLCWVIYHHSVKYRFWAIVLSLISVVLLWWMTHDAFINLYLGVGLDYIGKSPFDQFWGRICLQHGLIYLALRGVWLTLSTWTFFKIVR